MEQWTDTHTGGDAPGRCPLCSGALALRLVTHEFRKGDELLVFDNVPAWVCAQCDGAWVTDDVKKQLDEIAGSGGEALP